MSSSDTTASKNSVGSKTRVREATTRYRVLRQAEEQGTGRTWHSDRKVHGCGKDCQDGQGTRASSALHAIFLRLSTICGLV